MRPEASTIRSQPRTRRPRERGVGRVAVVATVALAMVAAGGAVALALRDSEPTSCPQGRTPLRVTVNPDLAPVVTTLAGRLSEDTDACVDVTVTATAPAQVLAQLRNGAIRPPDVWVPDSTLWLTRAKDDRVAAATDAPPIATSPLVLSVTAREAAGLRSGARPTVADLVKASGGAKAVSVQVASERLAPERVGTILALRAATMSRPDGRGALTALLRGATVTPAAPTTTGTTTATPVSATPGSVLAVPGTEQSVWAANTSDSPSRVAVYPGQATYDYPYAVLATQDRIQAAAGQLLDRLTMPSSQQTIRSAGFRDAAGAPGFDLTATRGVDGGAASKPVRLDAASLAAAETTLAAVRQEATLIAVMDVSGSMAWGIAGKGTPGPARLDIARQASLRGLSLYPDSTRVALWAFSENQAGGKDFRQVVGTTALDGAGRQRLAAGVASLKPKGDTALYETALAAVRSAQKSYDKGRVNAVVLLSDGADSQHRMSLAQLVKTLGAERSADRPVPVITVAFGPDADRAALAAISKATGGVAYRATSPDQIRQVFLDAVGQRACRPNCS